MSSAEMAAILFRRRWVKINFLDYQLANHMNECEQNFGVMKQFVLLFLISVVAVPGWYYKHGNRWGERGPTSFTQTRKIAVVMESYGMEWALPGIF